MRDAEELKKKKDDLAKMTETKGDSDTWGRDQPDSDGHLPESQNLIPAVDATAGIMRLFYTVPPGYIFKIMIFQLRFQ